MNNPHIFEPLATVRALEMVERAMARPKPSERCADCDRKIDECECHAR